MNPVLNYIFDGLGNLMVMNGATMHIFVPAPGTESVPVILGGTVKAQSGIASGQTAGAGLLGAGQAAIDAAQTAIAGVASQAENLSQNVVDTAAKVVGG